jgi:hypothetical protein
VIVIVMPHSAGYDPPTDARRLPTNVENVGRFARGEPLLNVADKACGY